MTGKESVYTVYAGHEVMYHVSTMLPHSKDNPQQLERKRHIGNDIVNIIYTDDPTVLDTFNPNCIRSQFTRKINRNKFAIRFNRSNQFVWKFLSSADWKLHVLSRQYQSRKVCKFFFNLPQSFYYEGERRSIVEALWKINKCNSTLLINFGKIEHQSVWCRTIRASSLNLMKAVL